MSSDNVIKGVIIAGGEGSRLSPFTNAIPKPMIPVEGIPLIKYAINGFRGSGIKDVYVLVRKESNLLKTYLSDEEFEDLNIMVRDMRYCCVTHSLLSLQEEIQEPFSLSHADIIVPSGFYNKIISTFRLDGTLCLAGVSDKYMIDTHPYSRMAPDGTVTNLAMKKPDLSTLENEKWSVWTGIYVFDNHIFSDLESCVLSHSVPEQCFNQMVTAGRVKALKYNGMWFHLGYKNDLLQIINGVDVEVIMNSYLEESSISVK